MPLLEQSYCIRASWYKQETQWLPVIGSIHSDPKHVRADFMHIHVDYRFLSETIRDSLLTAQKESNAIFNIHPVHSTPISYVWPTNLENPVSIDDNQLADIPEKTWLDTRSMQYLGENQEYPHHVVTWHQELSQAYAESSLINGTICPHQFTDLSGIVPNHQGVITCPLHGLQWCNRTKKIVMPTQPVGKR